MKNIFIISMLGFTFSIPAQTPKVTLGEPYLKNLKKHELMKDSANLYHDRDSSALFYYALAPTGNLKGALVLLAGNWEQAEAVLNNNARLIGLAYDKGIMTIVPSMNYNLCMDETALRFLNT